MRRRLVVAIAVMLAGVTGASAADPSLEVHLDPRKIGIEDTTVLQFASAFERATTWHEQHPPVG